MRLRQYLLPTITCLLLESAARGDDNAAAGSPCEQLAKLFADSWEFALVEDPLFATHFGDHRFDDRLPRETIADQARRAAADRAFLARLKAIPRDNL